MKELHENKEVPCELIFYFNLSVLLRYINNISIIESLNIHVDWLKVTVY